MEIIIGISLGLVIAFLSVFCYVLGVTHGRKVQTGCEVKLEPLKAMSRPLKEHRKHKEEEKERIEKKAKTDEFTKQINELFAYDGRKKVAK